MVVVLASEEPASWHSARRKYRGELSTAIGDWSEKG
jgi:hypothetical protein